MNEVFYNYILQALLGAAAGYITNDYAINMLFKEYTPLKIGGVIKKTRSEFIDNLSSLVENDIVNKEKLMKTLSDEEFKDKFEQLTEDFYKNCLYDATGKAKFADIDGIDSTFYTTGEFVEKYLQEHMIKLFEILFNDFNLSHFLTEEQINKITDSLYHSVSDSVKNTNIIEEELVYLYAEKGNIKLSEFIDTGKLRSVADNIILKLNEEIKNSHKTDSSLMDIYDTLKFGEAFSLAKNNFYEKSLRDVIFIDDEFRDKSVSMFLNYVNSNSGQNTVYDLCESLFAYIKSSNKTLFDIIDASFEINLKSFLSENLPPVTENIVEWIRKNNSEINKLIEDSVDEVIKEADPLKSKLLNTIKHSYLSNLSEKYNIVQKIIHHVEQETEPEKLGKNLSIKLIDYLSKSSIGEILSEAESNNAISPSKMTDYITSYLNNSSKAIIDEFIDKVLDLKIKDILPEESYSENIIKNKAMELIKNKIIASSFINKSLSQKLHLLLENYFNKNINQIITRDNLNNYIPEIKSYLVKAVSDNKNNISELLKHEIEKSIQSSDVHDYLKNNPNLSNIIKNKILNEYHVMTNGVKNKNLYFLFDKLNQIDNINKNSSEMLRNLIINNMETILSGSIKAIVFENLNKLSDDELVDFANDFIGRELQPIMYFGGILGLIAGIILAAVQNSPTDFGAVTIANMFTCALVGLLTNVIAIDMIFKPYKEIKILSKIPFLRNFALGYIVKNKNVFAKNTAHFVDNHLLSRESINELFNKYENNIKSSLFKGIAENDYFILQKILLNNEDNIVSGTYGFTKDLLNKKSENISEFFANKTDDYKISSLLSPVHVNYIVNLMLEKQPIVDNKLSQYAYLYLDSDKSIKSQIPSSFAHYARIKLGQVTEIYYQKTSDNLKNNDYVKSFILQYEDKYITVIDKNLNEIFSQEQIKLFENMSSHKISEIAMSHESRKNIMETVSKLIDKYVVGEKTFGEIFNGKVKNYVDSKIPLIFDKLSHSVKNNIIKSKPVISINVQNEIKQSLGLLERGMFSLMGGSDIVDDLMHKIIVEKLPLFIDNKRLELTEIFASAVNHSFYNKKVKDFSSNINKEQMTSILDSYFSNEENVEFINRKIKFTISRVAKKAEATNLRNLLKYFALSDLNIFMSRYEQELSMLSNDLTQKITANKAAAVEKISFLLNEISDSFIDNVSFKDLKGDITEHDVKKYVGDLSDILNKKDFSKNSLIKFINNYKEYANDKNLSFFISKENLKLSTASFIKNIFVNKEKEISIKSLYHILLKNALSSNFSFIHENTKSYAVNLFVVSSIKSIRRNLDKILKAVKFDQLAQEEIQSMEPKKIHEMFNSFMGKYFTRLKIYGVWGFVFGINAIIGLTLTGIKIIGEIFKKTRIKKNTI